MAKFYFTVGLFRREIQKSQEETMAGNRRSPSVFEALDIKFLAELFDYQDHQGRPVTSQQLSDVHAVTPKHVENRLEPFVKSGDVRLEQGYYQFEGSVWLEVKETGEAHTLGTWSWLFKERLP